MINSVILLFYFFLLQFDYDTIFAQPESSRLANGPDRFMKKFYNTVRYSCLYCWVFACGLPWVLHIALTNATIVWVYVWILLPTGKILNFWVKKLIKLVYSIIGDIFEPLGDCIITWLDMCMGHKCTNLGKKLKKTTKIVNDINNLVEQA